MSDEQTSNRGGRFSDLIRETVEGNEEGARLFLKQSWLSAANAALRDARYRAGLTQAEVAERLETTQSAIARLERDAEGRTTLHRFIDYIMACGSIPLSVAVEPFAAVRSYVIENPDSDRGEAAYRRWQSRLPLGSSSTSTTAALEGNKVAFDVSGSANWSLYRDDQLSVDSQSTQTEGRYALPMRTNEIRADLVGAYPPAA